MDFDKFGESDHVDSEVRPKSELREPVPGLGSATGLSWPAKVKEGSNFFTTAEFDDSIDPIF